MATFERSAAFWLRAYPRRWRAERGDELVAVLADLAGPDAVRVDRRTAWGLLRSGLATRWRGSPPLHIYLAYRFLGTPVPARYRAWVQDDILGPSYLVSRALWSVWLLPVLLLTWPTHLAVTFFLVVAVTGIAGDPRTAREVALRGQLAPSPYTRDGVSDVVTVLGPRRRIAASAAFAVMSVIGVTGSLTWTTLLGLTRPLALALGAGIVAAGGGLLLLRRASSVTQPHRVLVGLRPRHLVAAGSWVVMILTVALGSAAGSFVELGSVWLVVTPLALAVWWWSARRGSTLAAVDVWRALTGRRPRLDAAQPFRRVAAAGGFATAGAREVRAAGAEGSHA
ncbi:hypothetical protein [Cellulomonas sp. PhB150]|uniref:hypothetical protein n=1 Tax=Cellulomonas sp. PhB150 TaxID=2485188 RepID=UPI000F468AEA|nr:hypothetical protein [Cellulomonas sp. PhB150]ROS31765.1 hypothetical protein EDF34_1433 [Cellulomonas sp. PhB150]